MSADHAKDTPFKRIVFNKWVAYLFILLILSVTIFFLSKISFMLKPLGTIVGAIFLPVLLAGVCFYLFNPVIDFLERRRVKRIIAILALYLVIIGIIAGIFFAIVPPLKSQVQHFAKNTPEITKQIEKKADHLTKEKKPLAKARTFVESNFNKVSKKVSKGVSKYASDVTTGVVSVISTVTEIILALAMLPILLFYLLKDGKQLPYHIVKRLPEQSRDRALRILRDMSNSLSSYIRGQIIVSICVGLLLFFGYLLIGLKYALLLAVIAMATNVMPYLGPIIAIIPAAVIAIITSPVMILKLAIVWPVVQLIESKLISPQVMGKRLNMHPVTVIFVILAAGNLFGIVGLILAVPGFTCLKVIITHIVQFVQSQPSISPESKQQTTNN